MPLATAATLGAGAVSLLGGFMANKASAKEARRNRKFQLMMSSTAHQREVKDLRLAGLNPILSATGGKGSPMGSGSMAQQRDIGTPAVASALAAKIQNAQYQNIQMDTYKKQQEGAESQTRRFNNITTNSILENQATASAWDAYLKSKLLSGAKLSEKGYTLLWQQFLKEQTNNSAQSMGFQSPNQPSLKIKPVKQYQSLKSSTSKRKTKRKN